MNGKLTMYIPLILLIHEVTMRINQLKGIYFPKVREIVELIPCQTNDAGLVMSVPKESLVFSINL